MPLAVISRASLPHALEQQRVASPRAQEPGQLRRLSDAYRRAAGAFANVSRQLAGRIADEDDRPRRGEYSIEFARHDEPLELRQQAHPMDIGGGQAVR